jgi:hypothetical protein
MNDGPQPLRFPRGVRLAIEEDLPKKDRAEKLTRIAAARITTGYVAKTVADAGYSTYFEINAHADEVWKVFEALAARLLSDVAAPLIGWKDAEPTIGIYTEKAAAISLFSPHVESLQHDGFIQFGLMFQSEGKTEEILVKGSKDLQVWTNQPAICEETLLALGLSKVEALQFIDEFPRVTERLVGDPSSQEIISSITNSFEALPPR